MKRDRLRFLFRLFISMVTVIWFCSAVQWAELKTHLAQVHRPLLVIAILCHVPWVIPSAWRWKIIAGICGFPMSFRKSLRFCLIGIFFNTFLPTGNGGDVVRGLMASRDGGYPLGSMYATILVERMIGIGVTLCLVLIGSIVFLSGTAVPRAVLDSSALLLVCILAAGFLLVSRPFRALVRRTLEAASLSRFHLGARDAARVFDTCRRNPVRMAEAGMLTFVNQFIQIASAYLLCLAIPGCNATPGVLSVVIPLSFVAVLLPSIGGYGVREAGMVIFFGWFGISREPAAAFSILRLPFLWISALTGGIIYLVFNTPPGGIDAPSRVNRLLRKVLLIR